MLNRYLSCLLLIAINLSPAYAVLETYGARPMGMGGAFTGVADDANAPYWNPAGLALNPEVTAAVSTKLNNRNTWIGDNVGNVKLSYETEMNPFTWIAGIGVASALALEGAHYLSDQGVLKKGWGRSGEKTERGESMAEQVEGSKEVVSLKQEVKEAVKAAVGGAAEGTRDIAREAVKETIRESIPRPRAYYLMPWSSPWYYAAPQPRYYYEPRPETTSTKAQFALGISWLSDNNPPLDQNTNWYTLTLASGFEQRVALGAGINVYDLKKISTSIRGVGADLDLGFIARPVDYISLGLATKGILTTDIKWQDGSSSRYEMLVNAGLAVKPHPALLLAVDSHNLLGQNGKNPTMHYGIEAVLLPGLLARAGLSDGSKTAGLSVAFANLIVDYTLLGGTYNRTHMLGVCWRF